MIGHAETRPSDKKSYAEHNGGRVFSRPIYYPTYTPPLHSAKSSR